jgi:hypothetical protein
MTIAPTKEATQAAENAEAAQVATRVRRRFLEPEEKFALSPIHDDVIDAGARATAKFAPSFPGWQLHSRIYRGERMFDRQLAAWAVSMARAVSRARKTNGRQIVAPRVRRGDWIMQAGLDAMTFTIKGAFPATAKDRERQLNVDEETFANLRNILTRCMCDGWNNFDDEAKAELARVERYNRKIFLRQ